MANYTAPTNETTLLSTELNALADDDLVNGSTVLDNETNRHMWGVAELDFGASLDLSSGNNNPACRLYLIPSYDGTNYADDGNETDEIVPGGYFVGLFTVNKESTARRAILDGIALGPYKYKAVLYNDLGAAMSATGNTVKIKTYKTE